MTTTTRPGIDYSGPAGTCNRDPETGIRYGIMSANHPDLGDWFWDSTEFHYTPRCPDCGEEAVQLDEDEHGEWRVGNETDSRSMCEFACEVCETVFSNEWAYGDSPDATALTSNDETEGFVDESNDIWVTKSPYYTYAAFCSPCAPGAGHLESPCQDGVKTYCLGPDWFRDGKAPYSVFKVTLIRDNQTLHGAKTRFGVGIPVWDDGFGPLWAYRSAGGERGVVRAESWQSAWETVEDEILEPIPEDEIPDAYRDESKPSYDCFDSAEAMRDAEKQAEAEGRGFGPELMEGYSHQSNTTGTGIVFHDLNGESLEPLTPELLERLEWSLDVRDDE